MKVKNRNQLDKIVKLFNDSMAILYKHIVDNDRSEFAHLFILIMYEAILHMFYQNIV